jgi:hypothetical protein
VLAPVDCFEYLRQNVATAHVPDIAPRFDAGAPEPALERLGEFAAIRP